jgi:GNAT superfamily N-acetyltransferase
MFVAKAKGQVVAHARVAELAADEAAPGTPAGCYLSGILVDPAWRRRGIATALTRARLRWVFNRTDEAFCVIGADNIASLRLHAALGFQEIKRFGSERSAIGVDVLSHLTRTAAPPDVRPLSGGPVITDCRVGPHSSWRAPPSHASSGSGVVSSSALASRSRNGPTRSPPWAECRNRLSGFTV